MRLIGTLGVLCLMATPVMGGPAEMVFDVTAGHIDLVLIGAGSTESGMVGTFSLLVDASDGHIGVSDAVTITDGEWLSTSTLVLSIGGLATATVFPASARVSDFMQPVPGHIGPGGIALLETDAYLDATVIVTGAFSTTFQTSTNAGTLLPLLAIIQTSVGASDIIIASVAFSFGYEVGIPDLGMTITLDLIMNIEGTAHVPDPSLGGLTALGLAGAGTWLRNRRK